MPKVSGKRKKTKTHLDEQGELPSSVPRSLVLRRGKVGIYLQKLIKEVRVMLYPFCAINLKESRKNSLKDFLSIVDLYNLSHMFAFTKTSNNEYMRLARMPSGPTLTFKIDQYCFSSDLATNTENHKPLLKSFHHVPVILLNGFNSNLLSEEYTEPVKIVSSMFQSVFPPLNFAELEEKQVKKCILVNMKEVEAESRPLNSMFQSVFPPLNFAELEEKQVKKCILVNMKVSGSGEPSFELRHYHIDVEKMASKKTISNVINMNKTDFSGYSNIAEYILKQTGYTDNSDNEESNVNLSLNEKGTTKENVHKVNLVEIGPRLDVKLHKIEEGFFKGNVAFHKLIKKSRKEILESAKDIKLKKAEKRKRREEQKENIKKKEEIRVANMTEEEKQEEKEKADKKNRLLAQKRYQEEKVKKQAEKETVVSKRELRHLKNLKKGK
eukprot:CAMPEP_0170535918 /NCGR_PEP_ID=MMETSP0209-20121228/101862_1 /TAXON_ID=665100 ORGANISM="Litonotus pictus, Strain P1" /NCGR_SAMPLE_ID=MMETSP0209 /ASSEMBLY_ACC=CAM_ASM_000301 /LENGTH=438 /DNA_ID=CAMNT_0010837231 /DNA_START=6 /DNA_END=1323 /DNA_ORIENTATION=-